MAESPVESVESPRRRVVWGDPLIGRTTPAYGRLEVQFEDAFDCACYLVSKDDLSRSNTRKYSDLMAYLTDRTGYRDDQLLAHGQTVRGTLFFANERLAKADPGKHKIPHIQPTVTISADPIE